MRPVTVVEALLLWAGCAVVVLSSAAMLWTTALPRRLHLLAPVTSLGIPLIAAALVVRNGMTLTSAIVVLIALVAALVGPATGMAAARTGVQRARGDAEEPE